MGAHQRHVPPPVNLTLNLRGFNPKISHSPEIGELFPLPPAGNRDLNSWPHLNLPSGRNPSPTVCVLPGTTVLLRSIRTIAPPDERIGCYVPCSKTDFLTCMLKFYFFDSLDPDPAGGTLLNKNTPPQRRGVSTWVSAIR